MEKQYVIILLLRLCASFLLLSQKPYFISCLNQDFSTSVDGNPTSLGHLLTVSHFPVENEHCGC